MPPTGLSGIVVRDSMVDRRRVGVDVTVDSVNRRRLSAPTPQVNHRADADGRALWKCRRGHVDSYLEPHTMEMTGTLHARRHEAQPDDRARAARRTSRQVAAHSAQIDQPVKSWPSLVLHPPRPKHQPSTDGAALYVHGLY
jgi:hypothetical protein